MAAPADLLIETFDPLAAPEADLRARYDLGCAMDVELDPDTPVYPFEVWLAVPNNIVAPRLDQPALRVVRMSESTLAEGVEKVMVDGIAVPVFNAAKTVADCFKYRNKIGLDVALEALRDALKSRKANADELWKYAKINRVTNVMRPYLDAVA